MTFRIAPEAPRGRRDPSVRMLEFVPVGFVTLSFRGGSGSPFSPAQDGAAGALAEDKTKPDGRSAFRYVIVQRRKALKSSSLYILLMM